METDKKVIGLLLVLGFIGILLVASLIVLNDYNKKNQEHFTYQIINSYTFNEAPNIENVIINPTRTEYQTGNWIDKDYYNHNEENIYFSDYREYSGQERRKEFLGNYVQEYYVYILNKERTGRYFTVVFTFEDKNGYEYSESITQYIRSGEKEKFAYRDIQFERNEIVDWDYEVIPEER